MQDRSGRAAETRHNLNDPSCHTLTPTTDGCLGGRTSTPPRGHAQKIVDALKCTFALDPFRKAEYVLVRFEVGGLISGHRATRHNVYSSRVLFSPALFSPGSAWIGRLQATWSP
jgi:hypothetical protein